MNTILIWSEPHTTNNLYETLPTSKRPEFKIFSGNLKKIIRPYLTYFGRFFKVNNFWFNIRPQGASDGQIVLDKCLAFALSEVPTGTHASDSKSLD